MKDLESVDMDTALIFFHISSVNTYTMISWLATGTSRTPPQVNTL